jgi:hypothetical protein
MTRFDGYSGSGPVGDIKKCSKWRAPMRARIHGDGRENREGFTWVDTESDRNRKCMDVRPGRLGSGQVARFQQDVGDLIGKAPSLTGDQNPVRIFGIERRSGHPMLKQHPRAACPVSILDRLVA